MAHKNILLVCIAALLASSFVLIIACEKDSGGGSDGSDHSGECQDFITQYYTDCGYQIETMSSEQAYEDCTSNWNDFWECAIGCSNYAVSCEDLYSCIDEYCVWTGSDSEFICDDEVCTDTTSGLMWQMNDTGYFLWEAAIDHCDSLVWAGYQDWSLPTLDQMRTLIRGCPDTQSGGACQVSDSCVEWDCYDGDVCACEFATGPGPGGRYWPAVMKGEGNSTWTATMGPGGDWGEDWPWTINFADANIHKGFQTPEGNHLRCVRVP